ncbi:hypothetical protein [Rothia sp. ZJ932]|uniref:hypothetical protein n=1 Tax=Rothia sp. ZJ932 TaxID=2810516 RepID=UPI001968483A|nr:hypothetical protein [Rothia sp. ZJ932]QRZ61780.1 hypothetical protein JR346_01160 [Rothia sp. ZJ932]
MKKPILRVPTRVDYMHGAHLYARDHQMKIIQVKNVYQYAHRGEKAFVKQKGKLLRQDAWFHGMWPPQGSVFMVSSEVDYGPHHKRPTLYVYSHQIHDEFSPALYQQYLRWRRGLSAVFYLSLLLYFIEWFIYGMVLGIGALYGGIKQVLAKEIQKRNALQQAVPPNDSPTATRNSIEDNEDDGSWRRTETLGHTCDASAGEITIRSLTEADFRELLRRESFEDKAPEDR